MVQVTDLPTAGTLAGGDLLPISQSGTLKKVTKDALIASLSLEADGVEYDNASSGLTADTVQEAIDELSDSIASGVADGDKGDITVSSSGTVWTVDTISAGNLPTGIDAAKIGAGSVSNTEFGYLDGVTSAIQTQLNAITTANTGDQVVFRTIAVSGQSNVVADSITDTLTLVAGTNITITTDASTDSITINSSGGGAGLTDTDYGDITVSGTGTVMTIDNDVVTYAKMQNVSATDKVLGRSTSGSGDVEEIACTAAGRALLDDADASAQRTTLGLGTLATQSGTFSGTSSNTNTGDQNLFSTIAVSGQSNVVADATSDTLTLVAGTNITITTDATTDAITFNAAGGGGMGELSEDTTPQLGGDLDTNAFNISFDDNKGITDDSGNEQLWFQKTASAVNFVEITNADTGVSPSIVGTGSDTDVNLTLAGKGAGGVIGTFTNTGLHILDTNATHDLIITPGSNLTADRTLTITTGDADRTLTIAGTASITGTNTGDQTDVTGNAGTVTVVDAGGDTTTFPMLATDATGSLSPATDAGLTYNATTNALTTTTFVGALTGNASTATALATARAIGGVNFDGTAAIVPQTIESANEATDTTCFPLFITASGTQQLQPKNNTGLTYNSNTNALAATTFTGAVVGNASTATALATPRTIGGTSFDGTANIVPATITVADTTDSTSFVALFESATGDLGPKTDAGITYNASTGALAVTALTVNSAAVSQLAFSTIAVSGQSDVVADSATDTLTLAAGSNITLTTNAGTDTITIAASGGSSGVTLGQVLGIAYGGPV